MLIGSLLGGLAIHGAFTACSGSGNAGAQSSTNCQQWAVIIVDPGQLPHTGPTFAATSGALSSDLAPSGWEPAGGVSASLGASYLFRKCVQ
jgi:hypothetical protein